MSTKQGQQLHYAVRDLAAGEEVTFSYNQGEEWAENWAILPTGLRQARIVPSKR